MDTPPILDLTTHYRAELPAAPTDDPVTLEGTMPGGSEGNVTVSAHAYRTDPVTIVVACDDCPTVRSFPAARLTHTGAPTCDCGGSMSYRGWRVDEETPTARDERPTPVCDGCGLEFTVHPSGISTHNPADDTDEAIDRAEREDDDHMPFSMV